MRSQSTVLRLNPQSVNLGFLHSRQCFHLLSPTRVSGTLHLRRFRIKCISASKVRAGTVLKHGSTPRCYSVQASTMDEDSMGSSEFHDWDNPRSGGYMLSSSDGEDSDGDVVVNPIADVDLPSINDQFPQHDEALRVTAHRLAMLGSSGKKNRSRYGVLNNVGLITFLMMLLLFVDWCAWRIVRLPLAPFYLTRPFIISAAIASCLGYMFVPLLGGLKIHQIQRTVGPVRHSFKRRTPTMGGLCFVPVGIIVAKVIDGFSSAELSAASVVTLAFGAIGLISDTISHSEFNHWSLLGHMKLLLEIGVSASFSFWLDTASISSPYGIKRLVPLPAPLGLVCLGKYYHALTTLCFVSMGNGVNLTDGLDGLAAGIAAVAFAGMAIAVLPICAELAIFGASMAGACVGFLLHNGYKASVFMGDTGALALGGALAAMAACTGMFIPSFVSSGIFLLEALSVIMQVFSRKQIVGGQGKLSRMAPLHRHLELYGIKEPHIVSGAYVVACVLAVAAGYIGLSSA